MSKKLSVVFKRLQKHNRKQSKNIKIQQIRKQDIKLIINIKKKIWVLINNTSDISYMNSQLQWSLEIKEKKWKQSLIMKNVKWNKIIKITKKIEKTNMNIADHQK